jgi:hypothetical protein
MLSPGLRCRARMRRSGSRDTSRARSMRTSKRFARLPPINTIFHPN